MSTGSQIIRLITGARVNQPRVLLQVRPGLGEALRWEILIATGVEAKLYDECPGEPLFDADPVEDDGEESEPEPPMAQIIVFESADINAWKYSNRDAVDVIALVDGQTATHASFHVVKERRKK